MKQTYYDEKMTEDMRPSQKYRKRLANEMKYKIEDKQFMLDILAKLPKGSDDKALVLDEIPFVYGW